MFEKAHSVARPPPCGDIWTLFENHFFQTGVLTAPPNAVKPLQLAAWFLLTVYIANAMYRRLPTDTCSPQSGFQILTADSPAEMHVVMQAGRSAVLTTAGLLVKETITNL